MGSKSNASTKPPPPVSKQEAAKRPTIRIDILAGALGVSNERIQQHIRAGYFDRAGAGEVTLESALRGGWRHADHVREASSKNQAQAEASQARASHFKLQVAQKMRELIPLEDAEAVVAHMVGAMRSEMSGISARVTRDVAMRRAIEKEVHGSLTRMAEAFRSSAEALRAGGEIGGTLTGDNA